MKQTVRAASRRLPMGWWVRIAVAIVATVAILFPVYWMAVASFETHLQIYANPPYLYPPTPDFSAYQTAFNTQISHIITSLLIGLGASALTLLIAAPTAYALTQFSLRWTGVLVLALLITQMVPNIMTATPFYLLFNNLGLVNSYPGLILADSTYGVPFGIITLRAFLEALPKELREASLMDGAGELRTLWSVILPVSRPGVVAVALFAFLFGWSDFVYALTLTTTGSIQPLSLSIYLFIGAHTSDWNQLMATATIAAVPAAVLLVASQRYISAGLTVGSVRG